MPLDQEIKHLVDYYYSLNIPEFSKATSVQEIRDLMKSFLEKATNQLSPNLKEIQDHYFDTDIAQVRVRSFVPKFANYTKPVIFFRSSGFVIDNFDECNVFCSKLAANLETTVLSIDYPLAPEHPFPDPVVASYQTLLKLTTSAELFGIDSSGFVLMGESSGACIAASVSQMLRDKNGPGVSLQVLVCPVLDNNFKTHSYSKMGTGYILTRDKMNWYFSNYFEDAKDSQKPYALPLNAKSFEGLPKSLIITAQYDPLCDEGQQYSDQLKKAGVSCEYLCYKDMIHGFLKFNGIASCENAFLDLTKKVKKHLRAPAGL